MTRRKREIVGVGYGTSRIWSNSHFRRDPALPSPARPESARGQAILYSILLPRRRHCGCIPQSLRWRALDPRTGEAQAADLGYVAGCTSSDTRSRGRMGAVTWTGGCRSYFLFPCWQLLVLA